MTLEARVPTAAGVKLAVRRPMQVAPGTLEALKWLALVAMTVDHVNRYLFGGRLPGCFEFGRLAMPLFGFVLAYHLAQPGALARGVHGRVMRRLVLAAVPAALLFMALGQLQSGWWPLNVMFMLLAVTAIVYLLEKESDSARMAAAAILLFAGAIVDFWWFGILFCVGAWWYCRSASRLAFAVWLLAAGALYCANQSHWALAAMPLLLAAPHVRLRVPRLPYLFYVYYPLHLLLILLLPLLMAVGLPSSR
jgi:hypothetical protein